MRDNIEIKQGDCCSIPVEILVDDESANIEDIAAVEFMVGHYVRRTYPEEVVYFDGAFHVPLTQKETFAMRPERILPLEVRVVFKNGDDTVIGSPEGASVMVRESASREVL